MHTFIASKYSYLVNIFDQAKTLQGWSGQGKKEEPFQLFPPIKNLYFLRAVDLQISLAKIKKNRGEKTSKLKIARKNAAF